VIGKAGRAGKAGKEVRVKKIKVENKGGASKNVVFYRSQIATPLVHRLSLALAGRSSIVSLALIIWSPNYKLRTPNC